MTTAKEKADFNSWMDTAMPYMTTWVRQYSMRDLLDDPFELFKERASSLLLAGIIPYLLPVLYTAGMRLFVIKGNLLQEFTQDAFLDMVQSWRFWGFILGFLLCASISVGISFIAQCRIATQHALGNAVSLQQAFRLLAKPFWSLLVAGIIFTVMQSIVGSVASFIIMIFAALLMGVVTLLSPIASSIASSLLAVLAVLLSEAVLIVTGVYFLAVPIILATEHTGPFTALGKSFRYAAANFKAYCASCYLVTRVFIVCSLVSLTIGLLVAGAMSYIGPSFDIVIVSVFGGLGGVAFSGLMASYLALAYIDGRCRCEALDLLLLARDIGIGEEFERSLAMTPDTTTPSYPDYAISPASTSAGGAVATAVPGLTSPKRAAGFPDYSALPPEASPTHQDDREHADGSDGTAIEPPSTEVADAR